jgi:streptomycin 6-kinase
MDGRPWTVCDLPFTVLSLAQQLNLPQEFITTIQNAFGENGHAWLAELPDLIDAASRQWDLTNIQPVSNLSYNFVAFALNGTRRVVLKLGVPNRELTSEINALRSFDGKSSVRLLEADEKRAMFLLERLQPGEMLATLTADDRATQIAADVMLNLWFPPPTKGAFIKLSDWFKGFEKLRRRYKGGTGPFEKGLVERAEHSVANFFNEDYTPMLIHGDLHHYNILSSDRGWLAIDPKGVIGPAAYEVGPLLMNPLGTLNRSDAMQITKRRISILSERLGFERERIREWGIAHAVLSAWWDLEDNMDWGYAMHCAEVIAQA